MSAVETPVVETYRSVLEGDIETFYRLHRQEYEGRPLAEVSCHEVSSQWGEQYKDPDSYSVEGMKLGGEVGECFDAQGRVLRGGVTCTSTSITCTADGLISQKRIFGCSSWPAHEDNCADAIEVLWHYRFTPIFFFPSEENGINMTRFRVFGDRICCALEDIRRHYEHGLDGECACIMGAAYSKENTKKWLDSFNSFLELAQWWGVVGSFVTEGGRVYDLHSEGTRVYETGVDLNNAWKWDSEYYERVKTKIDEFYEHWAIEVAPLLPNRSTK